MNPDGSTIHRTFADAVSSALPAIAGGVPVRSPLQPLIFGEPIIGENDIAAVSECLRSHWIGLGPKVQAFEQNFAEYKGAPYAAALSSGTAAIHLALVALGVGSGDEVIAPTMTFSSTIHSIVHTGATPVLADCERTTFNIDPGDIERRITPRTKAIVVVHMCGRCCEMDAILDIARRRNLRVIEDCAHAIESRYRDSPAGLMGDAGCFSFYATKNLTTGDGGMVTTRDRKIYRRVKRLSLHGMTGDAWTRSVRGRAGYKVISPGFKCNMTDISAALGLTQLAEVERRWQLRQEIWRMYDEALKGLGVLVPSLPAPETRHAYHLYTPLLILQKLRVSRDVVVAALLAENIGSGIHYVPVHQQPYYRRRLKLRPGDFPNAAYIGERTLSLPLSPSLSKDDVAGVCAALKRILQYYAAATLSTAANAPQSVGRIQQTPAAICPQ